MKFLTTPIPKDIEKLINLGMHKQAKENILKRLKKPIPESLKKRLKFELFRLDLLEKAYPYSEKEAFELFKKNFKSAKKQEFETLLENGYIDFRFINGKKRFQERFHYNVGFTLNEYKKRQKKDKNRSDLRKLTNEAIVRLLKTKQEKTYSVSAKISIKRKNPKDEDVSVWLPVPFEKFQQTSVKITNASHDYVLSSPKILQKTVHMKGKDTETFWVEFSYNVSEWIGENSKYKYKPTKADLSEKPPHVLFTPYLKEILQKILKGVKPKNDYEIAKNIYDYLTKNVYYSYVLPYALYDNIPEYVTTVFSGDCGFYAITFITICRLAGIPAKWQSGWFATPYGASPHDWALIYLKDFGWIPVDLSFGGSRRDNEEMRMFYFGNLDGFRMFANLDFQADFYPKKKYFRNDPYDNQVGEMESKDGYIIDTESEIEILTFKEIK
ncbi:transglutaminase-like domain-containing protein [Thermosipho globiformans]|uniref:transglutaminase-like domain-containing protein n=1 Tax=Thermosipho globiformans TaxID=380685 RepID=UPI000F8DD553|nr:transglutaminase-like domain-containing protein [Thermosipho globiformans]